MSASAHLRFKPAARGVHGAHSLLYRLLEAARDRGITSHHITPHHIALHTHLRAMDMTSPTDFIAEPIAVDTRENFLRSHRGIFTTM